MQRELDEFAEFFDGPLSQEEQELIKQLKERESGYKGDEAQRSGRYDEEEEEEMFEDEEIMYRIDGDYPQHEEDGFDEYSPDKSPEIKVTSHPVSQTASDFISATLRSSSTKLKTHQSKNTRSTTTKSCRTSRTCSTMTKSSGRSGTMTMSDNKS